MPHNKLEELHQLKNKLFITLKEHIEKGRHPTILFANIAIREITANQAEQLCAMALNKTPLQMALIDKLANVAGFNFGNMCQFIVVNRLELAEVRAKKSLSIIDEDQTFATKYFQSIRQTKYRSK